MSPRGWTTVKLRDVAQDISYGFTAPASKVADGPKMLRITDIQDNHVEWTSVPRCECDQAAKYILSAGDIVIARTGATTGKSFLLREVPEPSVFASYLIRVQPSRQVTPEYLAGYMLSPAYWAQITTVSKGTAQPGANASILGGLELPLPPLNEQRRIVAKLEALQARSRRAREALDAIPPLLEKLRRSVLAAAFRGDLTKDWREKHPDAEPASELLKRIRVERRKRWEEAELAKMKAKGKAPKDDKWKAKYKEPEAVHAAGLPELPRGWCWASPDELSAPVPNALTIGPFGSDLKVSDYRDEGVPLVFVRDIRAERFGGEKTKFVTEEKAASLSRHVVQPGDLLVTKMGDPPGDTAVYPEMCAPAVITADCIKLTPFGALTDAPFLKYCFRAHDVRVQLLEQTAGVAQQKLSLERFRTVCVPLPPPDEQRALVALLDASLARAEGGLQHVEALRHRLFELERACLAKAFRGELVPQDPNDEPAAVMLERVRAEGAMDDGNGGGAETTGPRRTAGRRMAPRRKSHVSR